jgi:hypothetical protein
MSDWSSYVNALTQGESQDAVGAKVGVAGSTISRWRKTGSKPGQPAEVAAFALAYQRNVLEAFVAAGFLTPEEAGTPPGPAMDLSLIPSAALARELTRRLDDTPMNNVRDIRRQPAISKTSEPARTTEDQEAADAYRATRDEIEREQHELTEEP